MLQLGHWQLDTVRGGQFWLDAGAMYGVVPKTVWQAATPPDELNRIPLAIHCVLARNGRQTILIDTGYGGKLSQLERSAHSADPGDPLTESLAAFQLSVDEIDMVVFSHLHWDHVGGATRFHERRLVPTFPNATYFVNRLEWEDATSGAPELAGSYTPRELAPLEASGQLVLIDDGAEIVSGLRTLLTGGHTRGHQALLFESGGETAIYPGDICPDINHVRRMWCAAYDMYPLDTRRRKPELLGRAADQGWWVLWDHEPAFAGSRLERHKTREFVPRDIRQEL
jgi:glyoxylase-like metal-dependent hydrolase (beta-lactamase superfamily II)